MRRSIGKRCRRRGWRNARSRQALGRTWQWAIVALVALSTAGAIFFGAAAALSWLADVPAATRTAVQTTAEPLPIVRTADILLDHARSCMRVGHLHDALRLLDRIGIADPVRADADRLRADIQRDLLAAASAGIARDNGYGDAPVKCPKCDYLGFRDRRSVQELRIRLFTVVRRRLRPARLRYLSRRRR